MRWAYWINRLFAGIIHNFMAFAIFWLVIGDLITYHQKAIFGTDFYEQESPFNLPKKGENSKTLKIKIGTAKGGDKVYLDGTFFNKNYSFKLQCLESFSYNFIDCSPVVHPLLHRQQKGFRAPPIA